MSQQKKGITFHIINEKSFKFNNFFKISKKLGYNVHLISFNQWKQKILESNTEKILSVFVDNLCNSLERLKKLDNSNCKKILCESDFKSEDIKFYFKTYIAYFNLSGFIKKPSFQ